MRSDPPGAEVYVNGLRAGSTPCDHPFDFYGTVDVVLLREGHLQHTVSAELRPPWYQIFPLDLVTDLLWPARLRVAYAVEARLEPLPPAETGDAAAELLERSRDLEREARGIARREAR